MNKREQFVVDLVRNTMQSKGRFAINIHGDGLGSSAGEADIVTVDASGRFVGVECKADYKYPVYTQLLCGRNYVLGGGRYVIAYDDFDVDALDKGEIPVVVAPSDVHELSMWAFEHAVPRLNATIELRFA